jgi:hypothetical protein
MGDNPKQVQQTNDVKQLTGATSSTTNQQQQQQQQQSLTPYAPSQELINQLLTGIGQVSPSLTPAQSGAIANLSAIGQAGIPQAGSISNLATTLLSGRGLPDRTGTVQTAYDQYRNLITPTATGAFLDPNTNPFFGKTTSDITANTLSGLKAMYAGSGRDPALAGGDFQYNVGKGVGSALAPVFSNQYTAERNNQLAAIQGLLTGGTTAAGTLSALDQMALNARLAGAPLANTAFGASTAGPLTQLQALSMQTGIPLQTLAAQMGLVLPTAQAFGTTTGTGTGSLSGTTAGTQAGTTTGQGMTTTEMQIPLWQQILGGISGVAGAAGKLAPFIPK